MIRVFWDVMSSTLVDCINILEEPTASIFRVELISCMTLIWSMTWEPKSSQIKHIFQLMNEEMFVFSEHTNILSKICTLVCNIPQYHIL